MKRFLLPALLISLFSFSFADSALEHSTLALNATDQAGNPLPRAEFFLTCRMTFATPERFLCASDASGGCLSACMDCAPGLPATVRGKYLNHTIEQNISSWKGVSLGNCTPSSAPSNSLNTFAFTVTEEEKNIAQDESGEIEGASENIPENTSIVTKDFQLGPSEGPQTEYSGPTQAQDVNSGESCLPAFAFLFSFLSLVGFGRLK